MECFYDNSNICYSAMWSHAGKLKYESKTCQKTRIPVWNLSENTKPVEIRRKTPILVESCWKILTLVENSRKTQHWLRFTRKLPYWSNLARRYQRWSKLAQLRFHEKHQYWSKARQKILTPVKFFENTDAGQNVVRKHQHQPGWLRSRSIHFEYEPFSFFTD